MPTKTTEKRLCRTRNKCPIPLQNSLGRAMRETMIVLQTPKPLHASQLCSDSDLALKFKLAGSTGNVYRVTLDRVPTCTCPSFLRCQDICKHIMYTMVKVVGVPKSSKLVYQKALLSDELIEIHSSLAKVNKNSANGRGSVPTSSAATTAKHTGSSEQTVHKVRCYECERSIKPKYQVVICPRCHSSFHAHCLGILPSLDRLTLSGSNKRHKTQTSLVECRCCGTAFHHDEGYENIAHKTGQLRQRDHSSYRPCPGYPGYDYSPRQGLY